MKAMRSVLFALGVLILCGVPVLAATLLNVDARAKPPVPETGIVDMGSHISPTEGALDINSRYLTLGGKPWLPVAGEFHFSRFPHQYWKGELEKMKASGVSIVSTYIFWNQQEEKAGRFDWVGDRDLRFFVTLCNEVGLKVILRAGPWVHAEARFGGIPDWVVRAMPTRSTDPTFLHYVARYYGEISKQLKGLLWKDGGPVIAMQLDNEYYDTGPGRGADYIGALRRIAREAGIDVPFYTVTGFHDTTNFPPHEVIPMQGAYPDQPWGMSPTKMPPALVYAFHFGPLWAASVEGKTRSVGDTDFLKQMPLFSAEFGGGVPTMYRRRPLLAADDVAAMLPVGLGSGINLYGYYMFHGSQSSPDRSQSMEEDTAIGAVNDLPLIDYDYQAPLGAYGEEHPAMAKIRPIHYFLEAFGAQLAPMTVRPPDVTSKGISDLVTPRFSVRSLGDSGFLFVNNHVRQYAMADQKDVQFSVALPDETVTIPSHPIDIASDDYFIWPINMDLSGVKLVYATAQPITRVDDGAVPVYVFHAEDGIPAEFAFNGAVDVKTRSGVVARDSASGRITVTGIEAGTGATIEVRNSRGSTVRLLILATQQADELLLADIGGHKRLVLTNAQLYTDGSSLVLLSTGDPGFKLSVYPSPGALKGDLAVKQAGHDGVFQVYEARAHRHDIGVTLAKIRDAQPVPPPAMTGPRNTVVEPAPEIFGRSAAWTIKVAPDALEGVNDAFLRIDARGDVGRLFSGVEMLDDQFFSGSEWDVGLKRFAQAIKVPLTLTILPLRHDAPIYLEAGVDKMVTGDQAADVTSVNVVPQYRLTLDAGGKASAAR